MILLLESTKSHAWRACLLACFACSHARHAYMINVVVLTCIGAYVLGVLACLRACHAYMLLCLRAWRACMRSCLSAWHAYVLSVLACLRAWCVCVRASELVMMKCFIFFRVCVLGVLFCLFYFTFQYLNLKILTAKNSCALLSWTYFLFTFWYQLVKVCETKLREAGKLIDISYSYSCSKLISIFYNLYIHLLH